ncbi:hypothetical protein [Robiginitalea aurantiaca]|uniref:DUF3108 domain-containing protein n=1 Tax=Robiginitalea aurantiaca TaxID=3056915 RepID=A0ABT7WCR1_9FLAO|nr:hypothetical protein [Robiginitalea aurantiaca]MDM9630702.1 hypothetical protein [Robiginitalea aurantiaca]
MRQPKASGVPVLVLITLLLLLGSTAVHAQKKGYSDGYLITLKGDTLRGYIKDRSPEPFEGLYTKVRFKKKGRKKRYRPDQIRGYGYDQFHFESVALLEDAAFFRFNYKTDPKQEPVFLKVVRRNPDLILYEWEYTDEDNFHIDSFPLFYRPGKDQWARATQGIFGLKRKKLIPFFLDCPELALGIQNKTIKTVHAILEVWEIHCGNSGSGKTRIP